MQGRKVFVLILSLIPYISSNETKEEETTTLLPEPHDSYNLTTDYWLDLNDTFTYPDSYPIYDYQEDSHETFISSNAFNDTFVYPDSSYPFYDYQDSNESLTLSNVTYESLKKVLPIQLILDPLYGFSSSSNVSSEKDSSSHNSVGNASLLPVPLPLISDSEKKSFTLSTNPLTGESLYKLPDGPPISFNDTQTQAFVAISNTLLLLGSFFALQSLPGRLLSRRRFSNNRRKENKPRLPPPPRHRYRQKSHRNHFKKYKHRKGLKKHRRPKPPPPPPPPEYYDDEYGYYDELYDYDYEEYPSKEPKSTVKLPPPPPPSLPPLEKIDFKKLSGKNIPSPSINSKLRIKNIENHRLLPPIIDLNENQSTEELHENINQIKKHLGSSQNKYTTKQTFADTFTRRPDKKETKSTPATRVHKVPQLTPTKRVVRRKFYHRSNNAPIRRRPLVRRRRKYYPKHRRLLPARKTKRVQNRSRIDHQISDYDYEDENAGFYYEDSSPFAEDPYVRYPGLTQWYK